ncbi:MAG: LytTR family transcriptional regulator DNA-binding domain-containing protein [Bacteroidota bacterium]|nr:LytTR family transcriptional regulator DNA-binding domain-containing protein [Bacteroidota bacterium]MDP4204873.1 LytTR family transcriptional regulator DNA-binding domain-containing protein [Bacteroidota bacterium]
MEKIKTIIIEDEEPGRKLLLTYLKDIPGVEVIAECENGFEGVKAINELKPDLVFLDIQMPKITGFELLELIDHHPEIIFTTAYNQFAIKAFEYSAVDYLLKPFPKSRLVQAVEKATERINKKSPVPQYDKLSIIDDGEFLQRVVVKDRNKIHIIPASEIIYLESEDDYVMIFTKDGRHLKQKTMKYFEDHLDPQHFIRIHRSYIVRVDNIAEIQQYDKEAYVLILKSGEKLKVSKTGYKNLKDILNF